MNPFHPRTVALLSLVATSAAVPAQTFLHGALFTASDSTAGDLLGSAVGAHGAQVIVGAFGHDHAGVQTTGGAWIRENVPGLGWVETAKLVPADLATQDQFGFAVAITEGRAIVGSKFDDDLGSDSGSAYIFERQPDGTWLEVQKLIASDGLAGHEFGAAVSIDGDYAVVGAPDGRNGTVSSGTAYLFERQPSGTWVEVQKLLQNDPGNNDDFGFSVSIDGTRVVVGAYLDDDSGFASGSAYVFEQQPDGTWPEADKLIASDGANADYFGFSVAISGDYVVVGSWLDDDFGSGSGSAYVFERQSGGTWLEEDKLLPPNMWPGGHFGQSVALEGEIALIGTIHDRVSGQSNAGSATLFARRPDGAWATVGTGYHSSPDANDNFGHAVALGGGTAIVGCSQDDEFGGEAGSAGLFHSYGGYSEPTAHGIGTPGCDGDHTLTATGGVPFWGNTNFGFADTNAPALGFGWVALGDAADFTGADPFGLGIALYIDVLQSTQFSLLAMANDGLGNGTAALPIPGNPSLAGLVLHAQSVWLWAGCPALPSGLSSSNLLSFAVVNP